MKHPISLRARKQNRAREQIIRAAHELFRERGFEAVSVTDIVERAEVGRTTFFRYFGDKQEVVFANDRVIVNAITKWRAEGSAPVPASLAEAIDQLRMIVVALCARVTEDADDYERHYALIDENTELRSRDALKSQDLTALLAGILVERGADRSTAVLASQIALACYQTARLSSGRDPRPLVSATREAFDRVLQLGKERDYST